MVLTEPKTWLDTGRAGLVTFPGTAGVLASYLKSSATDRSDSSRRRQTYLTRLLAKTTVPSRVAFSVTVMIASAMLAATDLRTVGVLGGHLPFCVLSLACAAAARTAMATRKDLCAGIRTDKLLVTDISAAFDVDGVPAPWHLLLHKHFATDTVSVKGLVTWNLVLGVSAR